MAELANPLGVQATLAANGMDVEVMAIADMKDGKPWMLCRYGLDTPRCATPPQRQCAHGRALTARASAFLAATAPALNLACLLAPPIAQGQVDHGQGC
jgi:hypothetical protein